jgi:hypothetical protein
MRTIGIILIVLGILALAYQGISYTKHSTVIDAGPLKVTATKKKTIPLPPILGALSLAAGVVLLIASGKRGSANG